MKRIKGIYEGKMVRLLEGVNAREGTEVEVLFSNEVRKDHIEQSEELHRQIKESIAKAVPELVQMSAKELKADFDRLSRKIAKGVPFSNWKEAERFMRGERGGRSLR